MRPILAVTAIAAAAFLASTASAQLLKIATWNIEHLRAERGAGHEQETAFFVPDTPPPIGA